MRSGSRILALVALLVGFLVLSSCSTAPTTQAPSPSGGTPAPTKPSGTLTVGWSYQGGSALTAYGNISAGLGAAVLDSFLQMTPDGQVGPALAERWEISPDGLTQTFYLRKGVKFHDGSELTGEDAKFSLERIMDPKIQHLNTFEQASWPKWIDSIEVKDVYTVILHLKQPHYQLLYGFDRPGFTASSMILPKKYLQERGEDYFVTHPMGAGAWKVVKYEPGVRLELEANEDYWDKTRIPKFKNLSILTVMEESTKVAMLKTGELDLTQVAPDSASGLKAAGIRIVPNQGNSKLYSMSWYDLTHPENQPIGNVKVRTALSLAANRQELANKLFGGYAKPGFAFQVSTTAYFYDTNTMKPDPYDPEQAKKLIAEAGYPNGFNLTTWDTSGGGVASSAVQALVEYWRKVGVNAEVKTVDYSVLKTAQASTPVKPELWGTIQPGISGGNLWQDESLSTVYHSKGTPHNYNDPELDRLIDSLYSTKNDAERKQMAAKATMMGQQLHTDINYLDLDSLFAVGSKIGDFNPIKGGASMWGPVYATITHAK